MFNREERNPIKWIIWGIIGVMIGAVLALFFGFVVMWLWNWLMPTIFGLPTLTYWQAWGLVILFHILFKGGHHCGDHHKSECGPKEHFKNNWKKKFHEKMNDNFDDAEYKEDNN